MRPGHSPCGVHHLVHLLLRARLPGIGNRLTDGDPEITFERPGGGADLRLGERRLERGGGEAWSGEESEM